MLRLFHYLIVPFVTLFSILSATQALDWNDPKWRWMDEQIEEELRQFQKTGITREMLEKVMQNASRISFGSNLHHFKIIDRKVFGPSSADYNPKGLLEKVAELYPVPDVELILFSQDIIWNPWDLAGPVLVTSQGHKGYKMVHLPIQHWQTWIDWIPTVEHASATSPWETKIEKICWRGSAFGPDHLKDPRAWTRFERGMVCTLSKQFPAQIDASFSGASHWMFHSEEQRQEFFSLFPRTPLSWEEYISHKYLLDLDGYVAATPGTAWKLLSNCAVVKRDSSFTLWFSRELKPWVHYIPWDGTASGLLEQLQWMKEHDAEVKSVADNGRAFTQENLLAEHVYLYCYKVLVKYASLQRFQPSEGAVLEPSPLSKPAKNKKSKHKKHRKKH